MKKLIYITLLLKFSMAFADLDVCLRDAKSHGSHTSPLSPASECFGLIKQHPERIETASKDGLIKVYGFKNLVYVETNGKVELLSGDQTKLSHILKLDINEKKDRLLVLQSNSISTFNLGFIGNVSPLSHFTSPILVGASRVKLLDNEKLIAVFNKNSVRLVNSNAESRHPSEKTKPKLLNEIYGDESQLTTPTDLLLSTMEKKFYVLDSDRILVFSANVKKGQAPFKVIQTNTARSLKQKENLIFYVNTEGQETQLKLE